MYVFYCLCHQKLVSSFLLEVIFVYSKLTLDLTFNYTLNECFLINFFSVKNKKKHKEENVVVNDDHEGKFIYFCLF